jgi:hypothetical protein
MEISFKISRDKRKYKGKQKLEQEETVTPVQATPPQPPAAEQDVKVIGDRPMSDDEFEKKYGEVIRKVFSEENDRFEKMESEKPIVSAGRSSMYEGYRNYLPTDNAPVPTNFNFKVLEFLGNLSMWNRHISMAVENVVTLGNTDYTVTFGNKVGDKQAALMREHLWAKADNWYEFSDGEDSLDNDLLAQVATYGAISAEGVIMPNLRGIQNIVRVNPYYVRFAYDRAKNIHIPLQEVGGILDSKSVGKYPGYTELNPLTYNYIAIRRMGEMPYAIPPFLSALEDIMTENDMIKNFKNMMRRLGMLGFLSVLVTAPAAEGGETPQQYQNRLRNYLESLRPQVEKGFNRGVTMGFKGTHEFDVAGGNLNSANAETLMRMVKSLIFSGIKQDPNMHGENYSTTETFGRVILEKFTSQIVNYQKPVARFRSRMFKLELLLAGFRWGGEVDVKYKRPGTHDDKREQEVRKMTQDNLRADYQDGLISQQKRAELLGYDEPDQDEPRESETERIAKTKIATKSKTKNQKGDPTDRLEELKKKLKSDLPFFDYTVPAECNPLTLAAVGNFDPTMKKFIKPYLDKVNEKFNSAIWKSFRLIRQQVNELNEGASLEQVQAAFMFGLYQRWEQNFYNPVENIVEDNIEPIYSFYRKDKSIFEDGDGFARTSFFTIPDAIFELVDARAIQFLEDLDKIYLGKFITDPDTEKRILAWLKEKFEAGDIPLGKGSALITEFIKEFGAIVELEAWKIRRIIETTANRTRNIGNVNYLNQAQIVNYEIVEVMDDITCGYCKHMNRKQFSVKYTAERFAQLFQSGVENIKQYSPFATKFKLTEFVKMDSKTIQANGIDLPSYHPHCRGRIIADFKN